VTSSSGPGAAASSSPGYGEICGIGSAATSNGSSENLAVVFFFARCYDRSLLLLLLIYIFASLERFFCYNYSDLHCNNRRRTSPDFFCSDATLVQKFCSDVSGEVFRKITSPKKNCYNASIVKKNAPTSPTRSPARSTLFCFEPFFATMKQNRGFFVEAILRF
jgi:hypothetical protein